MGEYIYLSVFSNVISVSQRSQFIVRCSFALMPILTVSCVFLSVLIYFETVVRPFIVFSYSPAQGLYWLCRSSTSIKTHRSVRDRVQWSSSQSSCRDPLLSSRCTEHPPDTAVDNSATWSHRQLLWGNYCRGILQSSAEMATKLSTKTQVHTHGHIEQTMRYKWPIQNKLSYFISCSIAVGRPQERLNKMVDLSYLSETN